MKSVAEMEHNPLSETLVKVLCEKTQNSNPLFFRVLAAYYFGLIAAMMRVQIATHDRGKIPINIYALNLSTSGSGKGFSTNIIETEVISRFRQRFDMEVLPVKAQENLPKIAHKRALKRGTDPDEELQKLEREFDALGPMLFSFDSATVAAVKQMRNQLLMSGAGSINLQIDEIGSNLVSNIETLTAFLELYDMGYIKQKLLKNTTDNSRAEELVGRTPTNMLLFGTPSKLLNGGKVEEELYSMLDAGYARRCLFGYSRASDRDTSLTPSQIYDMMTNPQSSQDLDVLASRLEMLANPALVDSTLQMTKDTSLLIIEYRLECEKQANLLPEHEEIKKAEISHRYFKALKLAGAYAFLENSPFVTDDHVYQAIKLVEESGVAFTGLLTRDRNYVKLARYIANCRREVSQVDLVEDLPFYRGPASQKQEMLQLATAWGYQNNVLIKKIFSNGIEFLKGETLQATSLEGIVLAYSSDMAHHYQPQIVPWNKLHKLIQAPDLHWITHHVKDGHRQEDNIIPNFNLVVLDVDGEARMEMVREVLKDYTYLLHTTKRHTEAEHRFRVILPTNFHLKLDATEYKELMQNLYDWLPFPVDTQTGQRSRKWLTNPNAIVEYHDGQLMDILPFIPKTSRNEERKLLLESQQHMDNLERWVINNTGDGNRNNMLHRFARILVDAGMGVYDASVKVKALNNKLPNKLSDAELTSTVLTTMAKHATKP